mmetsp:Transcript_128154/g.347841  ORF Transcript_128154/g.347841 Transcript_128154/m.347841 type:complete len:417 (-) Transcript_128154:259-1509(-)
MKMRAAYVVNQTCLALERHPTHSNNLTRPCQTGLATPTRDLAGVAGEDHYRSDDRHDHANDRGDGSRDDGQPQSQPPSLPMRHRRQRGASRGVASKEWLGKAVARDSLQLKPGRAQEEEAGQHQADHDAHHGARERIHDPDVLAHGAYDHGQENEQHSGSPPGLVGHRVVVVLAKLTEHVNLGRRPLADRRPLARAAGVPWLLLGQLDARHALADLPRRHEQVDRRLPGGIENKRVRERNGEAHAQPSGQDCDVGAVVPQDVPPHRALETSQSHVREDGVHGERCAVREHHDSKPAPVAGPVQLGKQLRRVVVCHESVGVQRDGLKRTHAPLEHDHVGAPLLRRVQDRVANDHEHRVEEHAQAEHGREGQLRQVARERQRQQHRHGGEPLAECTVPGKEVVLTEKPAERLGREVSD